MINCQYNDVARSGNAVHGTAEHQVEVSCGGVYGRMGKKNKGLCVYCREAPATTDDHVVPRCLFLKPQPRFMVTVPVCRKCNHNKSRDEQYLAEVLTADIYTSEHPVAKAIFDGPMARARDTNRSEIARSARHAGMEALHTPGGLYLGHYATVPLDWERISRTIEGMIRGLYYTLVGKPFPQGYVIDVTRLDPFEVQSAWNDMSSAHLNGPHCLGDDIFMCEMQFVAEDPGMTRWLLRFYRNYVMLVTTKPKVMNPNLIPPW